jgi:hypothetical protein
MKYLTIQYDIQTKHLQFCYHLTPYTYAGKTYTVFNSDRRWHTRKYLYLYDYGVSQVIPDQAKDQIYYTMQPCNT